MGKTKSRANGDGDVFPRKNKAGKITSYRGAYVGLTGSGATFRARPRRRRASRYGKPAPVRTRAWSSTLQDSLWPRTWTAGLRIPYRAASGGAPTRLTAARRDVI
jgi:hypothetical protein